METKLRAAIVGPGNIGTDLLMKAMRSDSVEPVWMVGVDPDSPGLERAKKMGLKTTADGIDGLLEHLAADNIKIVFDATSAKAHVANAKKLDGTGVLVIDLTPAAIGPYCIPSVNLQELVGTGASNVNMVTCGGQATIPMVAAVSEVQKVAYGEIVATVASKSIGPGTRHNIDEFTSTTSKAIGAIGGAEKFKAIIVINPAEPPITMRDTVHCLTEGDPDQEAITQSVLAKVKEVQKYVPGYRLKNGPIFDGRQVSIWLEVEGLGDFLPKYSGNLDIMTAAALRTGEMFAEKVTPHWGETWA